MGKQEYIQEPVKLFDTTFGRAGEVLKPAVTPRLVSEYAPAEQLDQKSLTAQDQVVRDVENDYASSYDALSLVSPGMKFMAKADTSLLEFWLQNPGNRRILDIGPGTGRATLPIADAVGKGKVYAIDTAQRYLEIITNKAAIAGIDPNALRLAVGDIQTVPQEELKKFLEGGNLDSVVMWFGPLALMPSNPQAVFEKIADVLKPGGSLLLTTNSLNGLPYRVPEGKIKEGEDPKLPLGYKPSIFTRRRFSSPESTTPDAMILGNGDILPAVFYSVEELRDLAQNAGLEIQDIAGVSRLTGLFPENITDLNAIRAFIDLVEGIEPNAARLMRQAQDNPQEVFNYACMFDNLYAKETSRIPEYCYTGIKAVKPK